MSEDDITPRRHHSAPPGGTHSEHAPADTQELETQINALTEVVGGLASTVTALYERIDALENSNDNGEGESDEDADQDNEKHDRPASWVVFTPPAAAEDPQHRTDGHSPNWTLENFVSWFNATYVGLTGGPAQPIPDCWRQHPGLAMEIATLAYSWRRANVGSTANVRDAQYWHHTWRPGFTARLKEWVHEHCLDGRHRGVGAAARPDRFTPAESGHLNAEESSNRKEVTS